MAVITSKGLIGKISSVSLTSSEIKLITSDDINFKVSVAIKTNDTENYAILKCDKKDNSLLDLLVTLNNYRYLIKYDLEKDSIYCSMLKAIPNSKPRSSDKPRIRPKQE